MSLRSRRIIKKLAQSRQAGSERERGLKNARPIHQDIDAAATRLANEIDFEVVGRCLQPGGFIRKAGAESDARRGVDAVTRNPAADAFDDPAGRGAAQDSATA